jgi:hypothetical protein
MIENFRALRQAVVLATGLSAERVIWANHNAPQPALPYCTLQMLTVRTISTETQETKTPAELLVRQVSLLETTISINIYGHNENQPAMQLAQSMIRNLGRPDIHTILSAARIALFNRSDLRDLSFLQNSSQVERIQCDIFANMLAFDDVDVSTDFFDKISYNVPSVDIPPTLID